MYQSWIIFSTCFKKKSEQYYFTFLVICEIDKDVRVDLIHTIFMNHWNYIVNKFNWFIENNWLQN